MKIVLITNSDQYEPRVEIIKNLLKGEHEVIAYSTDFVHRTKTYRTESKDKEILLFHAKGYKKNLSVARLVSQWDFARRIMKEIKKHSPDVIYCLVPGNSFVYHAAKYKKTHPNVKLVFDIIDMWPESFPIKKLSWLPPFKIWKNIRDKYLSSASIVTAECGLFLECLGTALKDVPTEILYFAKQGTSTDKTPNLPNDKINLCYLGSVNNIIDIDFIAEMIKNIAALKNTCLHIVGNGERIDEFVSATKNAGAEVINHGVVYDAEQKQNIFNQCHFGINVMRDTVCVGLTMKSVDYFDASLPLLNNIKGDTTRFVSEYGSGFNVSYENMADVAKKIAKLSSDEFLAMRKAAIDVFTQNPTTEVFNKTFEEVKKVLEKTK